MRITFLLSIFFFFPQILGFCSDGSFEFQNNCYFFNSNATQFPDAELACLGLKPNGGHLASIHDGFVNALITSESSKLFNGTPITDFWIGLNTLKSPGNWSWTDNSATDFSQWGASEPAYTSFGCASMSLKKGYWSSADCFESKAYVCQIPFLPPSTAPPKTTTSLSPMPNCPDGWLYYEFTQSCFESTLYPLTGNWNAGEQYCQSAGGHLASFHDPDELRFVETVLGFSINSPWIGLYSNDDETTWKWSDGTTLDFMPPWGAGFPNLNVSSCVYLHSNAISDLDCYASKPFLCKQLATPLPTPLPTALHIVCREGWLYFEATDSCYGHDGFDVQIELWADGEPLCQNQGGHLISIHSKEEFQFLLDIAGMTGSFWTGFHSVDSKWKWSDGTPLDFMPPWGPLHPSLNGSSCGELYADGMQDNYCDQTNYILCKRPA